MTATVGTRGLAVDDVAMVTPTADGAGIRAALQSVGDAEHAWVHSVGRHTGRSHTTKVCFAVVASTVHVLAHRRDGGQPADWYRNLVAAGVTSLHVGGLALAATVVVPEDRVAAQSLVVTLLGDKYGPGAVSGWHTGSAALPLRLEVSAAATAVAATSAALPVPGRRP